MKGVLILNGDPPSKKLFLEQIKLADIVICADGAAHIFELFKQTPDLIIGDLDSIEDNHRISLMAKSKVLHIPDQNKTDGEKALIYCLEHGINEVTILGALGKRLDHQLYTLGLLKYSTRLQINLRTDLEKIFLLTDKITLHERINTTISLIPLYGRVEGVNSQGLKYPLLNSDLELGIYSSISNLITSKNAVLSVQKGVLLVCLNLKS